MRIFDRLKRPLFVLITALLVFSSVAAADTGGLSLIDCIRIALDSNPELVSEQWKSRAAEAGTQRAHAERMPRIDLNIDASESERAQRVAPPSYPGEPIFTDRELLIAETRLSIALYQGGALKNRIRAAEGDEASARSTLRAREQQLILDLVAAYSRIQAQRELIKALQAGVAALEGNLEVVKALEEVGRIPHLDALKVSVRLSTLRQKLSAASRDLENLTTHLARLMGKGGEAPEFSVQEGWVQIPRPVGDEDQLVQAALELRPELAAARAGLEKAAAEEALASAEGLPELRAFASYSFRGGVPWTNLERVDRHVNYAFGGLGIRVPLWTGGRTGSSVAEARAKGRSLEADVQALELLVREQVRQSLASRDEAGGRRKVSLAAVRQAEEALSIEQSSYEIGRAVINDVLDAQAALLNAQVDEVRAQADFIRASAELLFSTGNSLKNTLLSQEGGV